MAASLLAILIALGLPRLAPAATAWRGDGWFRLWSAQLREIGGMPRVLLALAVPGALCLLISWLLGLLPPGELWRFVFAAAVLLWSLGPRELEPDLDALSGDEAGRQAAARALAGTAAAMPAWAAGPLLETVAYAALRRRFGTLFWFLLLGPLGALVYRLAQTLGRDGSLKLDPASRGDARYVANALDWLPAHLLTFTLALVGHWDAVIGAWRAWHQAAGRAAWYGSEPGFLGAAARAGIEPDVAAGDGYAIDVEDPSAELSRLRRTLQRALLAWLAVIALIVLAGWLG